MPNKGKFIGSQDNLFVPDAPTIGAATAGDAQVSVAFTAPSDVGGDAVTLYGVSAFLAGATINYKVSVGTGTLSTGGSGNVYFIDGIPTKTLSLIKGFTYVFDLSDSSNSGHPFAFKDGSGSSYTSGVTTSGTAGNASATVTLVLATDASEPSRYYCTSHGNGMGNTISLIEASASTDPLGAAQAGTTGSSSPITVTGLTNDTSYIAQVWAINDYGNGPLSAATSSFTPALPPLGLFMGGSGNGEATIDFITITSAGNAQDFGDLAGPIERGGGYSSSTRAVYVGGYPSNSGSNNPHNTMSYVTMRSTGNATDFGDLTYSPREAGTASNDVRGITYSGWINGNTNTNIIDYTTIPTTGNATDFGDSATPRSGITNNINSPTRGVFAGGYSESGGNRNTIDYVTIPSAGNSSDFGDLTGAAYTLAGLSSNTRGVMAGPTSGESASNTIQYITIASTGNASDFGDLATTLSYGSGVSDSTTGVFHCPQGNNQNVLEKITIATTGNASDFGDLTIARYSTQTGSTAHGGINATALSAFAPAAIGLQMGGRYSYPGETHIGYVDITTTSNIISFGDLTTPRSQASGSASSTRAVSYTGYGQANGTTVTNIIEYVEFSTKGKATDFGNASATSYLSAAVSNGSRGVFALGYAGGFSNTLEYITFSSAGNTTDFGDLTVGRAGEAGGINSTTRGIFAGGFNSGDNYIDYITIASTGNATDFGDLLNEVRRCAGGGSSTRGIVGGGYDSASGAEVNVIQYVTIASTGNATDFGDLTDARMTYGGMSSSTRMIFGSDNRSATDGGSNGASDVLDYVTIASTGNATDFGDGLIGIESAYTSNSHGGIA